MINCNPETVSTDYDTADRLYFEPLTFEDVMAVIEREREGNPDVACVVQFGGQTPLKLALSLQEAGVTILGTSPDSIDLAEDRQRFAQLLWDLGIPQPASGTAISRAEASEVGGARRLPGGGAARPTCSAAATWPSSTTWRRWTATWPAAVDVSHDRPILIDRFLEHAKEIDVDCVADATGAVVIGGIMEHIEEAGIHSGDSSCVVPPPWPGREAPGHHARLHAPHRPRAEGGRADERAVRHQGRRGLRARGQPPRLAHGAVPGQGDRRAAGAGGGARDGGPDPGLARV